MGALSHPNLAMRPFRFVPTGTCVRYLIAGSASLLVHLLAFALLASTISIDGVLDGDVRRVVGADLVVYLDSSAKPALFAKSPSESTHADSHAPSFSATDLPHNSGLAIFSSYLSIKELDVAPAIVRDIDVSSAELQRRLSNGGKVFLRLWIDETGHVVRVEPLSSEMPSIYAETAARAFMRAEFYPGIKNGNSVKSKINIVLLYPAVQQSAEAGNVPADPVFPNRPSEFGLPEDTEQAIH